jgi:peptide/nickel transport system substrate-binding protein
VSDKNYQAKLLLYESLEALVRVLPRDLAVLQNNRKVELYPYQTNSWWYLGFNLTRDPYVDLPVRQAIACLVDIDALLAPIGTGDVVTGPYVPSSPYYNHQVPRFEYQPSQAEALLSGAGFVKEGNAWTRDGEPLHLKVVSHKTLESSQEVVINLQSQLQSAGIGVETEFLDDAAWKARVWKDRDYDLILSQWTFDRNEDIYDQFHTTGGRNFTGYSNPAVDALLDKARTATDPQVKKTALREVHRLVHEDVPMVFLWTLDSYAALSARVRNVVIHPFYFFTWVQTWRME